MGFEVQLSCYLVRPSSRQCRLRVTGKAGDVSLAFPLSRLGDVVAGLRAHEGVHRDAEGFLDALGNFGGEAGAFVEEGEQGRAGDLMPRTRAASVTERP